MVCFGYIIVNTVHKSDNMYNNNNNNNNNNNINIDVSDMFKQDNLLFFFFL
jgi:hypothetical protein